MHPAPLPSPHCNVGRVANLRPIANRPAAGPGKLLGRRNQPSFSRVVLNIIEDLSKLHIIPNQPIIALTLPERPGEAQHPVACQTRESLKRLRHPRDLDKRGNQQMNMIRHDDIALEPVLPLIPIENRVHDHSRDCRHPKIQRASTPAVENSIHGNKGFSRCGNLRELAICGEASMQSPSEEYGLADVVKMRQAATAECGHEHKKCAFEAKILGDQEADWQSAAGWQPAPQCSRAAGESGSSVNKGSRVIKRHGGL